MDCRAEPPLILCHGSIVVLCWWQSVKEKSIFLIIVIQVTRPWSLLKCGAKKTYEIKNAWLSLTSAKRPVREISQIWSTLIFPVFTYGFEVKIEVGANYKEGLLILNTLPPMIWPHWKLGKNILLMDIVDIRTVGKIYWLNGVVHSDIGTCIERNSLKNNK